MNVVQPDKLLFIIIGASKFEKNTYLHDLPSVTRSLLAFKNIILDPLRLGVNYSQILYLVDDDSTPTDHYNKIEIFLKNDLININGQYIFVIYAGHGLYVKYANEDIYGFALSESKENRPDTVIIVNQLFNVILNNKPHAHIIGIIDCCFSSLAINGLMNEFVEKTIIDQMIVQLTNEKPGSDESPGRSLICSAGSKERSYTHVKLPYTNFFTKLLHVLTYGDDKFSNYLTLKNIYDMIRALIISDLTHDDNIKIEKDSTPYLHTPKETNPPLEDIGIFRNPKYINTLPVDFFTRDFHNTLIKINTLSNISIPMNENNYLVDINEIDKLVYLNLNNSNIIFHLICYSLTYWKDKIEDTLLEFLERGGKFYLLMLNPDSQGFNKKTAMESFYYSSKNDNFNHWIKETKELRITHQTDIESSLAIIRKWKTKNDAYKIKVRLYSETPNIYGFLFDDKVMLISSYFINPLGRGFRNPFLHINDINEQYSFNIIRKIYLNWFYSMYATGLDPYMD